METKISSEALERTARNLGFLYFVSIPSVGTSGGLALLWRPSVKIDILSLSPHLVSCLLSPDDGSSPFTVYFVYGPTL